MTKLLSTITKMSHFYGRNPDFVLAGGGNTSCKNKEHLYVKPSGIKLAEIKEDDFVKMNRHEIRSIFETALPKKPEKREQIVKKLMLNAVCPAQNKRPSVEAPLHELLKWTYVVHLHPAMVNGMTCSVNGRKACSELFPESLWIDYIDPGYTLASKLRYELQKFSEKKEKQPNIIFLKNHGVFVGADSEDEIKDIYSNIMNRLKKYYKSKGIDTKLKIEKSDRSTFMKHAPELRSLVSESSARLNIKNAGIFDVAAGPLTPDHIVYAKSYALITENPNKNSIKQFEKKHGYKPNVISIPGKAVFTCGQSRKDAITVEALAKDAALVEQFTEAFGGVSFMEEEQRAFIESWEVESYRKKVASSGSTGRMNEKIAVITGAAQGFGYGIAEGLAAEGASVFIADMNIQGAENASEKINHKYGEFASIPVKANIADEKSVETMIEKVVDTCGGLDLLVANAGVLKAGSVKDFELKDWEFVTDVNYIGYFICVKHASRLMARQNAVSDEFSDIVQINSKSGLQGSNKNGAYAGSKFGTLGLTQSFALELIEDKIKVNSICPGNFFDGPLWSDPEKGLFLQYLKNKKVPGAKTLEDVKNFYENKVPVHRGCYPEDVVKAILYCSEQNYETGQAIPVTGGQIMLS